MFNNYKISLYIFGISISVSSCINTVEPSNKPITLCDCQIIEEKWHNDKPLTLKEKQCRKDICYF
jgi:hypothetical protein